MNSILIRSLISLMLINLAFVIVIAKQIPFDSENGFKLLCQDKDIGLYKISEVKLIVDQLEANNQIECQKEVRESILNSLKVIENNDDVCSKEKTGLIKDYHMKYISSEKEDNLRKFTPKSLRKFMIAYGLTVSSICKKNLINNLISDSHKLLNENDFKLMETFTDDKSGILGKLNGKPKDFNDIVLASDLLHMNEIVSDIDNNNDDIKENDTKKVFIQSESDEKIKEMQIACENRFKPFYDKLIIPLVKLADIGYNYKGEDIQRELDEIENNVEISRWYSLVYFCEILTTIEIVPSKEKQDKFDSENGQHVVDIISKEEAEKLKLLDPTTNELNKQEGKEKIDYKSSEGTPIEGDLIIDYENENFVKLIKNFDDSMTSVNRISSQFFSKIGKIVKDYIKSGKLNIRNNLYSNSIVQDSCKSADECRGNLVNAIDQFVTDSTTKADNPVSGHDRGMHYGIKNPDGTITEFKEKKKHWWQRITAHKIKMIALQVILVGVAVIVLLCVLGVVG